MADCSKNNNYPLLSSSALIRNISFNATRTQIQLILTSNNTVECTRDISSNVFLGVKIVNNNLVYTDAILGLSNSMTMKVPDNPTLKIGENSGVLNIIGMDDIGNGFSVTQLNIRFDAATNSVKIQF